MNGSPKIVLINPPQSSRYPQPPMGLSLIAAVLEREGYRVTVVDANALRLKVADIVSAAAGADIVGLTAMTPTINAAMTIARQLKLSNPDLVIILGGAHGTLLPEETLLSCPQIDIVVRGEGERTILDLVQRVADKQPLDNIPGISYRKEEKTVSAPPRAIESDLDSLPFLAYHLLPWQKYQPHPPHGRALPFAAIITSRGCPYQCSYCSKVFGNRFRGQSPERVLAEVAYYQQRFGVRELAFYDDVFTLNKNRANAIAEGIIKKGLKLHWTSETRVNLVDRELLQQMKRAGCYAIAYGIESASPGILEAINKGITLEQVEEAVRLTREVGMQTIGYFMIGCPGENAGTIAATIKLAKRLKLDFVQFAITTPLPGTELYRAYLKDGKDNVPWENFVYQGTGEKVTPVFESDALNREDLQRWASAAYKQFYLRPSYLWQRIRQTTSLGDLKVNLRGLSMLMGNLR